MQTPMTSTAMLGLALPAVLFAAVYFPTITQLSIALVSPYAKADVRKRLFAATIDGIPVIITWLLFGPEVGDKLAQPQVVEGFGVRDLAASFQRWWRSVISELHPFIRKPGREPGDIGRGTVRALTIGQVVEAIDGDGHALPLVSLWNTLLNKDTLDGKLEEEIGAAVESLVDGMLKPRRTYRTAGQRETPVARPAAGSARVGTACPVRPNEWLGVPLVDRSPVL
jgi:hypothetical protein